MRFTFSVITTGT